MFTYIHRIELFLHTRLELKVLIPKLIHLLSDLLDLLLSKFDHLCRLLVLLHRQCDLVAHIQHLHIVLVSEFLVLTSVCFDHTHHVLLFYIYQVSQVTCNSFHLVQMLLNGIHSCWMLLLDNGFQVATMHVHIEKLSDLVQGKHPGMTVIRAFTIILSVFFILRGLPLHHYLVLQC
jgi:hypothetical protein